MNIQIIAAFSIVSILLNLYCFRRITELHLKSAHNRTKRFELILMFQDFIQSIRTDNYDELDKLEKEFVKQINDFNMDDNV